MADNVVLVVDDDVDLCAMYRSIFETAGLSVSCVSTRTDAIAAEGRPACVILDWELPDGCGRDVARALRRRWGSTLPIILVTGAALRTEDVATANARSYLTKPFELDEVLQAVRDAVRRAGPRRRRVSSPEPLLKAG